jgi:hypothetical protein
MAKIKLTWKQDARVTRQRRKPDEMTTTQSQTANDDNTKSNSTITTRHRHLAPRVNSQAARNRPNSPYRSPQQPPPTA